jgi:hypothetical protein
MLVERINTEQDEEHDVWEEYEMWVAKLWLRIDHILEKCKDPADRARLGQFRRTHSMPVAESTTAEDLEKRDKQIDAEVSELEEKYGIKAVP